jgi:hypothetical protein
MLKLLAIMRVSRIDWYLVRITRLNGFRMGMPKGLAIMKVGQIDWYRVWITGVNGFEMGMPK